MEAELERIVSEDVSSRINQFDVICEAVTNAIQANATVVNCYFDAYDDLISNDLGSEVKRKVDKMIIADNGDGLNDDNFNSFCKYRTIYKKDLGCKGVGRLTFLKVYKNVEIKSENRELQEERTFVFDFNFDTKNLKKTNKEIADNKTQFIFNTISDSYYNSERNIDRRINLDLELIREKVLINLIPMLYFYKKRNVKFTINFISAYDNENSTKIDFEDIPNMQEYPFEIVDKWHNSHKFILNYQINESKGKIYTYYCANNRTVCDFSEKDFQLKLPKEFSGHLLLESEYFNNNVNNERNDFRIFPVKNDEYTPLSWENINQNLKLAATSIIKELIPESDNINKNIIKEISDERPYLLDYIDDDDFEIVGFVDKKYLIDKAKRKFDNAKEKLLTNTGKIEYTNEDLNDAINITQNELVSYIFDRSLVIERLSKLIDKKENVEKVIHDLFMTMKTDDDYYAIGKNNLWLLDDRYTTYSYAASDKRISEVLKGLEEDISNIEIPKDKPDLSIFFSQNPENDKKLKSVLVEIKPFDFKSKPDRKKYQGIQQLIDYVKAFKTKENIEEIYAYLVTDVDDKLAERLRGDDYIPLFSIDSPIYHRFYKDLGISIYVISAKTLVLDAEARNKVFLDIIKKQKRFTKNLYTNHITTK